MEDNLGDLTGSRPADQARLRGLGGPRFDPDRMLVPVEQVDREAAADLGRDFLHWTQRQCDITRNGEGDKYPVVQALAKHRLATEDAIAMETRRAETTGSVAKR